MGLLGKLFGQGNKPEATNSEQKIANNDCKSLQELLERYGGIAMDKQFDFGNLIGDNNWNVDMETGTISFGQQLSFPMQVLGTISHAAQSWLWAWGNTQSGLSEKITQQSLQLKQYGEKNSIEELSTRSYEADIDHLHLIGFIASGMFNSSGYYIADYGQGAMLVTIPSNISNSQQNNDLHKILMVFPQFISEFEMNHKNAFIHYISAKGLRVTESGNTIIGQKDNNKIIAEFDAQSRLVNLNYQ